jgi:hypothetical protein
MALAGGCLTNGKPIDTIASEFGNSAGYALAMLGQICRYIHFDEEILGILSVFMTTLTT